MSIGALMGGMGGMGSMVQEGMKLATEVVKLVGEMAKAQSGNKEGEKNPDKIAGDDMHNKNRMDFASHESTNTNVNINYTS
ncbi:hypothetical protein GIW50_21050 [Pseudomonas syringae]|uniref:Uncharacterized protein n=1 Tax=Pseudomonas syringae TaxID=317 RepID=A0A9Q3X3E4_PSESX|nr:hypothetical protein [Pseudomonas syringae]MCF5063478.1 hypothetical protein [Pseudomonas syringae]MCF5073464.1 hypothetical protein [Pseudomonas syringae]MCF5120882.1 hypothetical protein [Pseudomonas syringae]MCF5381256.1 hypothetical protein [Pseudomonas syringae]